MYESKGSIKDDGTYRLLDSNGKEIPDAYWVEEDEVIVLNNRADLMTNPDAAAEAYGKHVIIGPRKDSVEYGSYRYHHEFHHLRQHRATPCAGDEFNCFARHPVAEAIYRVEGFHALFRASLEGNPRQWYYFHLWEQAANDYACGKVPNAPECSPTAQEIWRFPWWGWITEYG